MAIRYDRGYIEPIQTKDGFLRAKVTFARVGVFAYSDANGQIRQEAKLPEELFSEFTIQSAKNVPVTDGHPPITDNKGLINTENYSKYVKGTLGDNIEIGKNTLDAYETIFDSQLIADLKAGEKREVSIGFETVIDNTQGEFEGQRYDSVQRQIRINHIAHVRKGRAGETVKIHLDAAEQKQGETMSLTLTEDDKKGIVQSLTDSIKSLFKLDEIKKRTDEMESTIKTRRDEDEIQELKKRVTTLETENENLRRDLSRQVPVEKQVPTVPTEQPKIDESEIIKKTIALIDATKTILPEFKFDGQDERQIKTAVIKKYMPDVKLDTLSNDQINAYHEASMEIARKTPVESENKQTKTDAEEIENIRSKRLNLREQK